MSSNESPESQSRIVDSPERRVGFGNWTDDVHNKLWQMVYAANHEGAKTGVGEMSAAIVAFTELDGEALCDLIYRYRKASISELGLQD